MRPCIRTTTKNHPVQIINQLPDYLQTQPGMPRLAGCHLLKQVFFNVAWNAIQAMPAGGELIISTKTGSHDRYRSPVPEHVEISVADSGAGIAEDDLEKIFNPFFTTKEKGTGLGLAIVHNIIEAHGGLISVKSKVGKGSLFTITLPLFSQETSKD